MKNYSENLVENLRGKKNFKNAERENNSEVEKVEHKNSVIYDHKDSDSFFFKYKSHQLDYKLESQRFRLNLL